VKKNYFAAILLLFVGAAIPASAQNYQEPVFTLLNPKSGDVLRAGQQVTVEWKIILDPAIVSNEWAEMELVFETGEGHHMRVSPQMVVTRRTFTWIVPNIGTSTGRLLMQAGIEGEGELYRLQQAGTFTIRSSSRVPTIEVMTRGDAKAGQQAEIAWNTANIAAGSSYDVMVSHDRGAHFHKAGSTTENRFMLPIAEDFAGTSVVQIVLNRANGTRVESVMTRWATVRASDKTEN